MTHKYFVISNIISFFIGLLVMLAFTMHITVHNMARIKLYEEIIVAMDNPYGECK